MSLTDAQARDEILGALNTAWTAGAGGVPLIFEDTLQARPSDGSAWAFAFVRKVDSLQATLAAADGRKRWRTFGMVTVLVRTPQGDGHVQSDALCDAARNAFRGKRTPGGVVFTNSRVREEGIDGVYTLVTVIADFEYDEIA